MVVFKRKMPFLRFKEKDVCAICTYGLNRVCEMTNGHRTPQYKTYFCSEFKRRDRMDEILKNKEFSIQITESHRNNVQQVMSVIENELSERADNHDNSKMEEPELSMFIEFLSQIKNYKYGTKEYNDFVATNDYCTHHFAYNDHHPEYFESGVYGMNLVNITEMFADWVSASTQRSNCSREEIMENITKLCEKFKIDILLTQILVNTVDFVITRLQLNKMR